MIDRFRPRCLRTGAILALAALVLAACGQLPRPFQPEAKPRPVLGPGPVSALIVEPVAGVPGDRGLSLAELVAAGLREREVAATAQDLSSRRYRLVGAAAAAPAADGQVALALTWRLTDPAGVTVAEVAQRETVAAAAWSGARAGMLKALADGAARKVNALLRPAERTGAVHGTPTLVIGSVTGAPGDGDTALAAALRASLKRRRVKIADAAADSDYQVVGKVALADFSTGRQKVTIAWTVSRADGSHVGTVSQANAVPRGSLDGPWAGTASQAAEGAADGLIDLLARVAAADAAGG